MRQTGWRREVVKIADRLLEDVFGVRMKKSLLYNMSRIGVGLEDVVNDPEKFVWGLERVFGRTLARLLERRLASEIAEGLGLGPGEHDLGSVIKKLEKSSRAGER